MSAPTVPSSNSKLSGDQVMNTVWYQFVIALLAHIKTLEDRITALEP